jgi:hypothetical protein
VSLVWPVEGDRTRVGVSRRRRSTCISRTNNAFVLDNGVLMSFLAVDIRAGDGVEPYYSTDDIDEMITVTADSM